MKICKIIFYSFLFTIGKLWSFIYSFSFSRNIKIIYIKLYSAWISKEFNHFGKDTVVQPSIQLVGGKYITIGDKSSIGIRASLSAWGKFKLNKYNPQIIIGSNVSIGDDCHITAINRIEIGNNVLIGKKITITDNSHGEINFESLLFSPVDRRLYSEGAVFIEDNVWIGDKVSILPNVRIGQNSIIGANAVVTKDIPANCVAVGIPAKVIKKIE